MRMKRDMNDIYCYNLYKNEELLYVSKYNLSTPLEQVLWERLKELIESSENEIEELKRDIKELTEELAESRESNGLLIEENEELTQEIEKLKDQIEENEVLRELEKTRE